MTARGGGSSEGAAAAGDAPPVKVSPHSRRGAEVPGAALQSPAAGDWHPGGGAVTGRAQPGNGSASRRPRSSPRGAEEARPRRWWPPCGGMAAAVPRSGGWRPEAVLLRLLAVLLLAGAAGAGQRSKWRLPVLMVSAGREGGKERGRPGLWRRSERTCARRGWEAAAALLVLLAGGGRGEKTPREGCGPSRRPFCRPAGAVPARAAPVWSLTAPGAGRRAPGPSPAPLPGPSARPEPLSAGRRWRQWREGCCGKRSGWAAEGAWPL